MENPHARHTFAYLSKTRRIDNEIISDLMHQKKIYESLEYFANIVATVLQWLVHRCIN